MSYTLFFLQTGHDDRSFQFWRQFRIQQDVRKKFFSTLGQFFQEIRPFNGVRIKCKPMPFVFCRDLWFLFDLWFLRNLTSISSRDWWLMEFRFLNVCIVPYLSNEWKWLIFVCSVIAGCISLIVWKKSSISSYFSPLPLNVIREVVTGRIVIDLVYSGGWPVRRSICW